MPPRHNCQQLPATANNRQQLPASNCQQLPTNCQQLPATTSNCQQLPATSSNCQQLPTTANDCQQLPATFQQLPAASNWLPDTATATATATATVDFYCYYLSSTRLPTWGLELGASLTAKYTKLLQLLEPTAENQQLATTSQLASMFDQNGKLSEARQARNKNF